MCWTVGCPEAELGPTAGLSTVVPLELDITAAAAAPARTRQIQSECRQENCLKCQTLVELTSR